MLRESIQEMLDSSRFFYVQEGIGVGFLAAIIKTIFLRFPLIELYAFVGPIVMIAFGLKTWGDIKKNGVVKG